MAGVNEQLATIFDEMAKLYQLKNSKDRFRTIAYKKAAQALRNLQEDAGKLSFEQLDAMRGIGVSIAKKIKEFTSTGKIDKYEKLKKNQPYGLLDVLDVQGFGPKVVKKLHKKLKISNKEELEKALVQGKASRLKGFGKKKIANMLKGIKLHKQVEDRILLWDALQIGENLLAEVKKMPGVKEAELAGSLRRMRETIGDIDILVSAEAADRQRIINSFVALPEVKDVLAKGDTKVSVRVVQQKRQVDLRIIDPAEWGAALLYFTGSKEHNVALRKIAIDKGFKLSEYGLFHIKDNKKIAGTTEEEVYKALGFSFIPPELREDKGELELAAKNKIPKLVALADIKGDLQMHSTWSDGLNTIEEIAGYLKNKYEYISVTDHSKAVRIAHGLDEKKVLAQIAEIKKINKTLGFDFLKSGIEVDINDDGTLNLADEILEQLQWVTASIHTNFNQDNTHRLIMACQNPYVNAIGHPTGRLFGSREAYEVNLVKLTEAAAETGTALEINAQPDRLDLNDDIARLARENGVMLVINTDSHSLSQFNFMKLGVAVARRACCTKANILNTMSWAEVENFVQKKRKLITAAHA